MKVFCRLFLFFWLASCAASGISLIIPASRDNTLYEDEFGTVSNGAGEYMFVGRIQDDVNYDPLRRGVIAFDLSSVPAGAVVRSATVRLYMSKTVVGPAPIAFHRLTANWGEGTSDPGSRGGMGAPARPGDATWLHTFFNGQLWATPGGDFYEDASAVQIVEGVGFYTWGPTVALARDVTEWLSAPGQNFGWILISDEANPSAKRLNTRHHLDPSRRPALLLEVDVPLKLSGPTLASNHLTFSFTAQANQSYLIERRAALSAGSWSEVTNIAAAPALRTITVRRPLTTNQQFYRVVAP